MGASHLQPPQLSTLRLLLGSGAWGPDECSRSQRLCHLLLSLSTAGHWVSSSGGLLAPPLPDSLFC